jgi:hypothetical protein
MGTKGEVPAVDELVHREEHVVEVFQHGLLFNLVSIK